MQTTYPDKLFIYAVIPAAAERERIHAQEDAALDAIKQIANGHNDPRIWPWAGVSAVPPSSPLSANA